MSLIATQSTGFDWHGRYKIDFKRNPDFQSKSPDWLKDMLAKDMMEPGACEAAIFPDPVREV